MNGLLSVRRSPECHRHLSHESERRSRACHAFDRAYARWEAIDAKYRGSWDDRPFTIWRDAGSLVNRLFRIVEGIES